MAMETVLISGVALVSATITWFFANEAIIGNVSFGITW